MRKRLCVCLLAVLTFLSTPFICLNSYAEERYYDDNYVEEYDDYTGYIAFVADDADLFTEDEEDELVDEMLPIIEEYGSAGVVTIDDNPYGDVEAYATDYLDYYFDNNSCVLFVIDMDTRMLTMWASGNANYTIDSEAGTIITDNVFRLAHENEYYECASKAMEQAKILLGGGTLTSGMKIMSNIAISIVISLILTYFIARAVSSTAKASDSDVLDAIYHNFEFDNVNKVLDHTTKEYSPKSSSSSGGGGGGGGGHSSGGSHGF